jgi:hypothetical protein
LEVQQDDLYLLDNSKAKEEKTLFFNFKSSYAGPKSEKVTKFFTVLSEIIVSKWNAIGEESDIILC